MTSEGIAPIMVNGLTTMTQTKYNKRVDAQREQVRKLHAAGLSAIQIARATGVTRSAVYQMLDTLKLPTPSKRDEETT